MKIVLLICLHLHMSKNVEDNFLLCNSYTTQMCEDSFCCNLLHCFICNWIKLIFKKQRWKKLLALLLWKDIHLSIYIHPYTALQQLAIIHWIQSCIFMCVYVYIRAHIHTYLCVHIGEHIHTYLCIPLTLNIKILSQFCLFCFVFSVYGQVTGKYNHFQLHPFFIFFLRKWSWSFQGLKYWGVVCLFSLC